MWTSAEIAKTVNGKAQGAAFEASGVTIDSRKLPPGALFVAFKGERVDGHDYVKQALAAGAAGALVEHVPQGLGSAPLVVANDVQEALAQLGRASRARTHAKIIAVTGSVGKTGTKEAIRVALAGVGKVYATHGNLNNHIGLPLSLANLPQDARFGVFELGMNHAGELSMLTAMARPDIAVITNVEAVHLEFFANVEGIADAKAEIMEGLGADGTVILNRDNAFFERLAVKARARGLRIVTFGEREGADCRLTDYRLQDMGAQIEAVIHGTPIAYRLGAIGRHWALTSLAALAAALAAGADLADAAAALAHFHEPDGRGKLMRLVLPNGDATLIDDCYNASPSSTSAAIAKLAELSAALGGKGRTIAVLGDMLELGTASENLHRSLLAPLSQHHIDKVYLAGSLMQNLYETLPPAMRAGHAESAKALASQVTQGVRPGDIVLVKGSRGSRMDIVRDALLAAFPNPAHPKEPLHAV